MEKMMRLIDKLSVVFAVFTMAVLVGGLAFRAYGYAVVVSYQDLDGSGTCSVEELCFKLGKTPENIGNIKVGDDVVCKYYNPKLGRLYNVNARVVGLNDNETVTVSFGEEHAECEVCFPEIYYKILNAA